MKNASKQKIRGYLLDCLFYMVVSVVLYNNLLFRCLPGKTYIESKIVLWMMIGLSFLIYTFILNRCMRTGWMVATMLIIPLGLYTVLTYIKTVGSWILITLISTVILTIVYSVSLMRYRIKKFRNNTKTIKRSFRYCYIISQSIVAIALLMIMGAIGIRGVLGYNIISSSVTPTTNTENDSQTIINNIDTILLLQEKVWNKLTIQEKLDALQTVANIEARYLGLPNELNVGTANLGEYTNACYNDRAHTISIDLDHLENDSVHDVLGSLLHESYHSYQHRLVDAYRTADNDFKDLQIYKSAAQYEQEFNNYVNGNYDFGLYYYQKCEMDARDYAENAINDYYDRINEYLNSTSTD